MSWFAHNCVVVPIDFSEASIGALSTAKELVEDLSRLHVIHVIPPLSATDPGVIWGEIDESSRRDHADEAIRQRLGHRYAKAHVCVAIGDPGHEIADYAESVGADLIVMPSHGRTGARRVLLGSVAERVVRFAPCPVLVLKDHESKAS